MNSDPATLVEVTPEYRCDVSARAGVIKGVECPDADLVQHSQRGDLQAFTRLVGRHQGRLLRYALHILHNREDAEEAVQDTLVRAYRGIRRADPERFGAWSYRILVNRCRSLLRRRQRRWRLWREQTANGSLPPVEHPADGAAWREEIDHALASLPLDQREAFVLKHVEDLDYHEMSRATGASVSALKMRVSRAIRSLRHQLRDPGEDQGALL